MSIVNINEKEIELLNGVTLLGLEIDSRLNFEKHISAICNNAAKAIKYLTPFEVFLKQRSKDSNC